jgi:predicted hydrocarbon binding protein
MDSLPPDNLAKEFDFADIAALLTALEGMYGPRGGRGLAQRAGRALFANGLKNFGALAGAGDLAFKVLPLGTKVKIAVPAIAKVFTGVTDQISNTSEHGDHYLYTLERCSMCWQRKTDKPTCHVAVGIIQEAMKWMSGGREFKIDILSCMGSGDDMGRLKIYKEPLAES